jgi:hypothetical protein
MHVPPRRPLPRRIHFVTDTDRGFTLDQIHIVEGSDIIYSELHERLTDGDRIPVLPAVAIMRTLDDLPAVGRDFNPEIVSELTRGTNVFCAGRVEALTEEPYFGPPPVMSHLDPR